MRTQILGVKIDNLNMAEALAITEKWIWNPGRHYIVTPNPEMIVVAQKDLEFKKVLNQADMAIPDGAGLKLASDIESTIPGVDFMEALCNLATEKGFTTGFLGGKGEVAKEAAKCLQEKYPGLKVVFAESGPTIDKEGNVLSIKYYGKETNSAPLIHNTNPIPPCDLLFVAFGHIKQEKWIANNLDKIPVHVAMGVGGAFDYISGRVPRAPKWVRRLGFEWLFRLIIQPWRIKRQLVLFKYLWLILVYGHNKNI